jgi:MoaA/NifB/PqqE/SkfB family radical SAM enzyme
MKEFIEIETTNSGMVLELDVGYICNYQCEYCSPTINRGTEWINFEKLKEFLTLVKPSTIIISGGEPTIYPHIVELLTYLKNTPTFTCLITNATGNLKKYKHLIDFTIFTFHIDSSDLYTFIENVSSVSFDKVVKINIPMVLNKFDECLLSSRKISLECPNALVILKALVNYKTGITIDYTDYQLDIMRNYIESSLMNREIPISYKTFKLYSDGSKEFVTSQVLITSKDNCYKGWLCWKGLQTIKVIPNGDVYNSTCEVGNPYDYPIGNIKHLEEIKFVKEPQICKKNMCNCATNLKAIKKVKSHV